APWTSTRGSPMSLQSVRPLSFEFFPSRPVPVEISPAPLTTDAGLIPIRQFDDQIRLTAQFAAALEDQRDPKLVEQSLLSMVRQRIYGILADYEDQNAVSVKRTPPSLGSSLPPGRFAGRRVSSAHCGADRSMR